MMKNRFIRLSVLCTLFVTIYAEQAQAVDSSIEWRISPSFGCSGVFSEGLANCGIISHYVNKNGETVYMYPENSIRYGGSFSCGFAVGSDSPTGTFNALIDKQGQRHVLDGIVKISDFHDNMAAVEDSNMKYGYINTALDCVVTPEYDYGDDFHEGYAHVRNGDEHMYINSEGIIGISDNFKGAGSFSNGLAPVKNANNLWGYIDYNGNYVIYPQFTSAKNFQDSIAVVTRDYQPGIIDSYGNFTALNTDIDLQRNYSGGVSVVHNSDGYGLVDTDGKLILECSYDEMSDCIEGVITAKKDDRWVILNNKGETIGIGDIAQLGQPSENLISAAVKEENELMWGFIANPLAKPSAWAKSEINEMFDVGCMTDAVSYEYQNYITRIDFCELAVKSIQKNLQTVFPINNRIVFKDTDNINIAKLNALEIIDGVTDDTFEPNTYITREQIAKIVMRLGKKFCNFSYDTSGNLYNDNSDISEWAREDVYSLKANSIMYGSDNIFRPKDCVTKEEAILIISRLIKRI